jgi:hypothetical protein
MAKKKAKTAVKKASAQKTPANRKTAKKKRGAGARELIDTGRDKRYVRRKDDGQFLESDDVGRSLAADKRTKAKKKAKRGQGDRGDR